MTYYENIVETANYIKKYFGEQIDYAVVLGSGITLELEDQQELGYEAIPLFPGNKHANRVSIKRASSLLRRIQHERCCLYDICC